MTEGLDAIEQRVAGLIERYREAKQQIGRLESRLHDGSAEREKLGRENDQLRARVGELENELASRNSREDVVKNRLQQILGQIDSLETEIARMEPTSHES
jgi:chromosome segregation ATPase